MVKDDLVYELTAIASIAATFVGTVVGAGFASGREVYQFFVIHGFHGILGVMATIIMMGLLTVKIFKIGLILKTESYYDFLAFVLGLKWVKVADFFLGIFLLLLIGVMLAGCGAIFQSLGAGYWVGVALTALILIIVLFRDLPGLIFVNAVVIPLMFVAALGISVYSFKTRSTPLLIGPANGKWLVAAVQFSAYNLVLSLPVLLSLASRFKSRNTLYLGGWIGCLGLGLMAAFIHLAISSHLPVLRASALPMLALADKIGVVAYWGYAIVLWGEMLTTLLANAYGLSKRLVAISGLPYAGWVILLTVCGIIIARVGFTNLIAWFYPVYGYLSLGILLMIMIRPINGNIR